MFGNPAYRLSEAEPCMHSLHLKDISSAFQPNLYEQKELEPKPSFITD